MVGAVSRAPDPPIPASNHTKVRRRPYNAQWCHADRRPARPPKLQQRVLEACTTCRGKHGNIGLFHQDQGGFSVRDHRHGRQGRLFAWHGDL
eukprot:scaffold26856_cov65-Phaeocystis_antarctica.AAC.4